jgi:hypothetical protein
MAMSNEFDFQDLGSSLYTIFNQPRATPKKREHGGGVTRQIVHSSETPFSKDLLDKIHPLKLFRYALSDLCAQEGQHVDLQTNRRSFGCSLSTGFPLSNGTYKNFMIEVSDDGPAYRMEVRDQTGKERILTDLKDIMAEIAQTAVKIGALSSEKLRNFITEKCGENLAPQSPRPLIVREGYSQKAES